MTIFRTIKIVLFFKRVKAFIVIHSLYYFESFQNVQSQKVKITEVLKEHFFFKFVFSDGRFFIRVASSPPRKNVRPFPSRAPVHVRVCAAEKEHVRPENRQ